MSSADTAVGAILAGGRSTRFGADKRVASFHGEPLVERVARVLGSVVNRVVLVTADGVALSGIAIPAIADEYPSAGPLAGIHAALSYALALGSRGALIVGCDMPFISAGLLQELIRRGNEGRSPAVAPQSEGRRGLEPLCAWYSCAAFPPIEAALSSGQLSPHLLLAALGADILPLDNVRNFGDPAVIFRNLNTPDDLAEAERTSSIG